jgi:signal transduction histidine kinase
VTARAATGPLLGISRLSTSPGEHYARLERSGLTVPRFLRIAGVHFVVGSLAGLAMLAWVPPTEAIGDAGWPLALGCAGCGLAVGIYMLRTPALTPALHLGILYLAVVLISIVVWACGTIDAPYTVLLLLTAQHVAIHPPRRALVLTLVIVASVLVPLLSPDLNASTAALALLLAAVMVMTVLGLLYRLGTLYGDEAVERAEAASVRAAAQLARREAEHARGTAGQMRELDALKDDFVSTVSHELRTPLTSVKGYLEAILAGEAGALNNEQREYTEIVYRNSTRLQELVDDLLVLSRVDAGELVLRRERFDLVDALRRVREEHGPRAAERGLVLELDAPDAIPLTADRRRIEQTIANLVSNAVKYGGDGDAVKIRAFSRAGEAVVEVMDQGVGIPAGELSRIGERFFRAANAGDVPGSGLGLAITREIVQRHGGTLEVQSAEGSGSTFRVSFPLSG